ncbi:MAG: TIGR02253 family HAD-type hydrolase [Candidatus Woesearchaeota archaeon]|jgi:putative hydrolase of the HAD superfamily|nr:TIGR02253 family HAD-type hydrolase [Candidatus Woesearchaeota archaeon]MDP7623171.1 TIGR02253 family HAD-type hydrolase [Candidatus Woesearchaeota archaeon]HJN56756.1 TIGR02253 family HAD-type hydrolase [Candidatus Woesearchaeota archaeon]|tara:strand:+ start:17003 stop:17668 length:666 start_codon:yes stop_codon:yes gene_type:complete
MIKAVIFDLDNTLVDFMKMKNLSCEAAIDAMIGAGLKVEHEKAIKALFKLYDKYGLEEKAIFQKFLKKVTGKIDYKILASAIVAYRRVRTGFLEPYPNVDYILLKLKDKGIKIGIVTDAPKLKAWIRLASIKLSNYFDVVVTFEDTKQHKPSKLPFLAALKKLDLKAEQCLMVGDWPERDIKGANDIGMKTCFARYGNPKIKKSNADYEINDIRALLNIVK